MRLLQTHPRQCENCVFITRSAGYNKASVKSQADEDGTKCSEHSCYHYGLHSATYHSHSYGEWWGLRRIIQSRKGGVGIWSMCGIPRNVNSHPVMWYLSSIHRHGDRLLP
jgi:hypothetical protein